MLSIVTLCIWMMLSLIGSTAVLACGRCLTLSWKIWVPRSVHSPARDLEGLAVLLHELDRELLGGGHLEKHAEKLTLATTVYFSSRHSTINAP